MNPSDSSADEFPLPHSTRALPRALIRLHQRCRGELVKERKGWEMLLSADEARRTMGVIEELLEILRVDFRPDKLKPVVTVPKNGPFDYGGMVTATLEALGACDRWMTYNEIVDWVDAAYKLGLEGPARVRYLQRRGGWRAGAPPRQSSWTCLSPPSAEPDTCARRLRALPR